MSGLVRNALRTPDGTVLESKSRHDYKEYADANGNNYMIDGGLDYTRRSANGDEEDLTVTLNDGHKTVREALTWGTYGPDGDQELTYVRLCDMSTDHIEACLKIPGGVHPNIRTAMENELEWRQG